MSQPMADIKIFALNGNPALAAGIAAHLGRKLGDSSATRFADGEINMRVYETVRGSDVFIIQPTAPPVNDNLMELLIMIDALHRSSAERITAVIPYFGYARQDRKARSHDPISAKLVANLLTTAGADRVLSMDLHCPQLQGFFDIPVDHLRGVYEFAAYYKKEIKDTSNCVAVSPDLGSVSRVRQFSELMGNMPMAIVDKRRSMDDKSEVTHFIGDVEGKDAIIADDVATTAGSLTNAAAAVMKQGARSVRACVTHPVLCGNAVDIIEASALLELVVLNTIAVPPEKQAGKIKVLDVSDFFGDAIDCIHNGKPISGLFAVNK